MQDVCFSLNVKDQGSHPYKTTCKIIDFIIKHKPVEISMGVFEVNNIIIEYRALNMI
jgi:hypothetical protein